MISAKRDTLELVANVSLLFGDAEYLDRFSAAATAGFQGTETWWPFSSPVPGRHDIDRFLRAVDRSGIPLVGLNLFAGDMAAGERGLVCRPDRRDEFAANLDVVVEIAALTGCRVFNALYGQRQPGQSQAAEDRVAIANLTLAAQRLGDLNGTVLVEPLTAATSGTYPITTAAEAVDVISRAREHSGLENIGLLFDTFHLANNGDDLIAVVEQHGGYISHVQVADTPGRGQPGTGSLPIPAVIDHLWASGYRGAVSCEYEPRGLTTECLGWIRSVPHLELG